MFFKSEFVQKALIANEYWPMKKYGTYYVAVAVRDDMTCVSTPSRLAAVQLVNHYKQMRVWQIVVEKDYHVMLYVFNAEKQAYESRLICSPDPA
jgi:hypothetical protein